MLRHIFIILILFCYKKLLLLSIFFCATLISVALCSCFNRCFKSSYQLLFLSALTKSSYFPVLNDNILVIQETKVFNKCISLILVIIIIIIIIIITIIIIFIIIIIIIIFINSYYSLFFRHYFCLGVKRWRHLYLKVQS